jgi:hypothetical protein
MVALVLALYGAADWMTASISVQGSYLVGCHDLCYGRQWPAAAARPYFHFVDGYSSGGFDLLPAGDTGSLSRLARGALPASMVR